MQKNDVYSEWRIDIAVKSPAAARITDVKIKGTANNGLYQIRKVQDGSYAIGFKNHTIGKVKKSAAVTLNVYLAGSDKPVAISITVAAA